MFSSHLSKSFPIQRVRVIWIAVRLSLTLIALSPAYAAAANEPGSSATLPLSTVLEMQKKIDDAAKKQELVPPIAAAVHRVEVSGRLLDEAVEFNVHYDIQVLQTDTWVEIPLIHQDTDTHLLELPDIADGAFALIDGTLSFVTHKRKRYRFDLTILKQATLDGQRRSLRLPLAEAAMSICKLTFDDDLFELLNTRVLAKPDGVLVFPSEGAYVIEWAARESRVVSEVLEKPEIASVIPTAYASSVSTLEGMRITRILYRLRFAGRKSIEFEIPKDQTVVRAYLNGFAVPVSVENSLLKINAAPARAGDEAATIELVLNADDGVYHLAGDVAVGLPRASWPIHEIFFDLHLPEVFNYRWKSGSLSPAEQETLPTFTYQVPQPGKRMSFHQFLVSAQTPQLKLSYAVDLEDQYFCAQKSRATTISYDTSQDEAY